MWRKSDSPHAINVSCFTPWMMEVQHGASRNRIFPKGGQASSAGDVTGDSNRRFSSIFGGETVMSVTTVSELESERMEPFAEDDMVEVALCLPGWQAQCLEAAAHQRGLTVAQLMRRFINDGLDCLLPPSAYYG
jgi:hypothetical protein